MVTRSTYREAEAMAKGCMGTPELTSPTPSPVRGAYLSPASMLDSELIETWTTSDAPQLVRDLQARKFVGFDKFEKLIEAVAERFQTTFIRASGDQVHVRIVAIKHGTPVTQYCLT